MCQGSVAGDWWSVICVTHVTSLLCVIRGTWVTYVTRVTRLTSLTHVTPWDLCDMWDPSDLCDPSDPVTHMGRVGKYDPCDHYDHCDQCDPCRVNIYSWIFVMNIIYMCICSQNIMSNIHHWCIKSIYNGFAIAIDCTLKVVPFGFCSVQVMPLFRISFWLLRRSDKNSSCSGLRFFLDLGIFEANLPFVYLSKKTLLWFSNWQRP